MKPYLYLFNMIQTANFSKMKFWIGRITISLIFFFCFVFFFLVGKDNMLVGWIISTIILFVTIAIHQVGDLKIENQKLTYEIKSLVPILYDKNEIDLKSIDSISLCTDQTSNERGFMIQAKFNKNIVQIRTTDGSEIKIPGKIYPGGASALKRQIESITRRLNNHENFYQSN